MQKIKDYEFDFGSMISESGICRLRMFADSTGQTVFVCTEQHTDRDHSIRLSTMTEAVAFELWKREGVPPTFLWIEHIPTVGAPDNTEQFHQVKFVRLPNTRFLNPSWTALSREQVEQLIGQSLD